MPGKIIEIAGEPRHLSIERGFLVVSGGDRTGIARVPLGDILSILLTSHGYSLTSQVIASCLERGIAIVPCGTNFMPAGVLWPIGGHWAEMSRLADQIAASEALKGRIWANVVGEKIRQQAACLDRVFPGHENGATALRAMANRITSGDKENIEAQAAARYWPALFGPDFRRDRDAGGINGLLNYGYAILRSLVARSVVACGLSPSLGIKHSSQRNAFVLVDDLIECFRPIVDEIAWRIASIKLTAGTPVEVDAAAKAIFMSATFLELHSYRQSRLLQTVVSDAVASFGRTLRADGAPAFIYECRASAIRDFVASALREQGDAPCRR